MPPKKVAKPAQENISLGPQARDGKKNHPVSLLPASIDARGSALAAGGIVEFGLLTWNFSR